MQTRIKEQTHSLMTAHFNFHKTCSVTSWWKFVTWKGLRLCTLDEVLRHLCPMQLGVEVVDGVIPIIEGPLVAIKPNTVV